MNEYEIVLEDRIHSLYIKISDLQQENKQLKERYERLKQEHIDTITRNEEKQQRIDKAIENCKKSIASINQKLQDDKTIKVEDDKVVNMNEYQRVRLKAIRMKCKELLEILGDKENE